MKTSLVILAGIPVAVCAIAFLCAFASGKRPAVGNPDLSPAREAYARGDFALAEAEATRLLGNEPDEARLVLFLVVHASGRHERAIALFGEISRSFPGRKGFVEPACWSLIRLGRFGDARALLEEAGKGGDRALLALLKRFGETPPRAEISDVATVPFVEDVLSPYFPGVAGRLAGIDCVARLDTGGSWVHVTASFARKAGIKTFVAERGFASLSNDTLRYGISDLELGGVRIANVPVCVHERGLSAEPIAAAFGLDIGPIVGTNVLALFYPTIDGPGRRLVLSPRGDAESKLRHDALFPSRGEGVPFLMWGDHYMVVPSAIGPGASSLSFVDSGLVVVTEGQGQASMLVPEATLLRWGGTLPEPGLLAELPGAIRVGSAEASGQTAYVVDGRGWDAFGDWGGLTVDSLVSWGYLKRFAWTIDFDSYRYWLSRAPRANEGSDGITP